MRTDLAPGFQELTARWDVSGGGAHVADAEGVEAKKTRDDIDA
jgi:hypothetical protein